MASNTYSNLLLLFDRPMEPVFMPRGDENIAFDVPRNYIPDNYKDAGADIISRLDPSKIVTVKDVPIPDISMPLQLGRRDQFLLFIPRHSEMAARLVDVFIQAENAEDLLSMAVYCRDRVNPYMFNYALSVALLHRNDTNTVRIPNIFECFPDKFLDGAVFSRAREEANVRPAGSRIPITIPRDFTGTNLDPEHRVAYFREDLGINLHHWHWHLVYPFMGNNRAVVDKDRRGELFYYMHEQVMARYNCERFANQLGRVRGLNNLRQPIPEGYFPKLDSIVSSRTWPPRFVNAVLRDINRPADQLMVEIDTLEDWMRRIRLAIAQGFVLDRDEGTVPLNNDRGIDILGNMIEAVALLSVNSELYGNLHNFGHLLIAYVHDPDGRFLEGAAVMGDSATAMRDPVFYRWHAIINDLFQMHKNQFTGYSTEALSFPNVTVNEIRVEVEDGSLNRFQTFWQQSDIDMSRGLDFSPPGSVFVRFTHLQHRAFTYRIRVTSSAPNQVLGYVRIFMAPRFDEKRRALSFNEQRLLMIEMDKFRVGLRPGQTLIVRRSDESSVTIPYERTFRNLPATGGDAQFNFCGCGWPQHMLVPRGTADGMEMDLFVMISEYSRDSVERNPDGACDDADSYCGIFNNRYPDRRPMGYPFDRNGRNGVSTLQNFLTPNMAIQRVQIVHTDETLIRPNDNITEETDN